MIGNIIVIFNINGEIMINQKRNCYFVAFFKKGHIVTALLAAACAITVLLADFEYGFLANLYARPKLFVPIGLLSIVSLFLLSVAVFKEVGRPGIAVSDAFALSYVLVGLVYGIIFFVYDMVSVARLVFAGLMVLFGIISLIRGAVCYNAQDLSEYDVIKRNLAGYYSVLMKKYSFIVVLAIAVLAALIGYSYMVVTNIGLETEIWRNPTYKIAFYIGLGVIGVCTVVSLFNKKVNFFDVYVLAFLIAVPLLTAMLYIMRVLSTAWLIRIASLFVGLIIATIIRCLRFDPKVNDKDVAFTADKRYFKGISAKYTVLAPVATGVAIFMLTLILFRYTQFFSIYRYFLNGTYTDGLFLTIPYLVTEISCHVVLLVAGIIAFASIKSKTVCLGDAMLSLCISYMVCALLSFAFMEMSTLGLLVMIVVFIYVVSLLFIRIVTVRKAAKKIK